MDLQVSQVPMVSEKTASMPVCSRARARPGTPRGLLSLDEPLAEAGGKAVPTGTRVLGFLEPWPSHLTDAAESSPLPDEVKSTQLQEALCHPGWALGQPRASSLLPCPGPAWAAILPVPCLVPSPRSLTLLLHVQTHSCSLPVYAVRVSEPHLLHLSFESGECMSVGLRGNGGHGITWVAVLRDCPAFVFEVEPLIGLELH